MRMLEVKSLSVSYGAVQALSNVSVHVAPGEFVSLIGSNGAGKTTLLNSIMNIIGKSKGAVTFDGKEVTKMRTPTSLRREWLSCRRADASFPT